MGKIKLNIKNTQLAAAFGRTKEPIAPTTSNEPLPESKAEKEAVAETQEAKKKLTRFKADSTVAASLKQGDKKLSDKTLSAREKEELLKEAPKRKARIMKTTPEGEAMAVSETTAEELPIIENASPTFEEELIIERSEKEIPQKTETPTFAPKPTAPTSKEPEFTGPPKKVELPPPPAKAKELKTVKKKEEIRFDSRDRQGLRDVDNEAWRKRRQHKPIKRSQEEVVIRPKKLSVRVPITIKDLAQDMKLKASQLISKLLMKGVVLTLNDYLDDETTLQLLGHDFDCEITIDTSEEKRIRITDQTIRQEIEKTTENALGLRPPVVTFMGHVDHGKTSLIDSIRKSNRVAGEAGAITQHIGAFKVKTVAGDVTILDTPGHEAFSEMRSRGANVTDIVILVIAGDEGIRAQTDEAIRQAREAKCPILVAINKADKANFDVEKVYRELADRDLLPEAWGGTTITVNCSAASGAGVTELLEMIALQAEILELRANVNSRARGTILESEMHKGLGAVATVLVQNGTLRKNDAIVFGSHFGRIKTMQDEYGKGIEEAGPSMPVKITGLSDLALAGSEFIVVKTEKEARDLAKARSEGEIRTAGQVKVTSLEKMMAKKESGEMKVLPVILRADVQGSLEALKSSLLKIQSKKVRLEIVNADVGEISESDIDLALASKSTILGFHTHIESHAADQIKQKKVPVLSHDVIYHIVDDIKERMKLLLDKLEQETETGKAFVKAVFKSSQLGMIAGCQISEGTIKRNCLVRQIRGKDIIWKGKIASLKRGKEDIKEVKEGFECGILLEGQRSDIKDGDILEAYEITYLEQDL